MSQSQYSLSWESFKTNICSGFSALQQNGEFVDMTLAADGHFVKVHQVLVALSSTYLKNLMASAPCQHPVIFLNNVSHKVLCYILEYIYTGEVLVPTEYIGAFAEAAKSLHIKGLENVDGLEYKQSPDINLLNILPDSSDINPRSSKKRKTADVEVSLPPLARKVFVKPEGAHLSVNQNFDTGNDSNDYTVDMLDDTHNSDDDYKTDDGPVDIDKVKANPSNLLYTVSIRGSLQAILNRYIYNLNSTTSRTGMRRWRCVDYRNNKCNAFIITKGNVVLNRANLHNHPYHDKKILSKIEKKAVFSAYDEVEAYRDKEKEIDHDAIVDEDTEVYTMDQFKDEDKN